MTITEDPLVYAGFWRRLGANLLDALVLLPFMAFINWQQSRSPDAYTLYVVPEMLINLAMYVWMVKRYGGSPGKLISKLSIRRLDGSAVGYREALLRYLPEFIFSLGLAVALAIAANAVDPQGYAELTSKAQQALLDGHMPVWHGWLLWISGIWWFSELVVLLTNRKKRALHDFIAGTVVIRTAPEAAPPAPAAAY